MLRILYTSLIDRTLFVLWRAMWTAAPAGAVIWLLGNIVVGGDRAWRATSPAALQPARLCDRPGRRDPAGLHHRHPRQRDRRADDADGLHGAGHDDRPGAFDDLRTLLVDQHGWTMLTAVNLMLFSLLHNPCATT